MGGLIFGSKWVRKIPDHLSTNNGSVTSDYYTVWISAGNSRQVTRCIQKWVWVMKFAQKVAQRIYLGDPC